VSDHFYRTVRRVGSTIFALCSRPVVIGLEHVPRVAPFILAATHLSEYDVPLLIRHTPRPLDFVSITEVFRNPLAAWFYGSMNAFPLERSRPDAPTVRIILERLREGRAVAMFPEGSIRSEADSVISTRRIRPGLGRLAGIADVPVVPCVVLNSAAYRRPLSWLPLRRVRYGLIYGPPLVPNENAERLESDYILEIVRLHTLLRDALHRDA